MDEVEELKKRVSDLEVKVLLAIAVGCTPRLLGHELVNGAIEEQIDKLAAPADDKQRAKVLLHKFRPRDPNKLA